MTCLDLHWPQEAASAAADGTVFHWNLEQGTGVQLSPPEAFGSHFDAVLSPQELQSCCVRSFKADWEKRMAISGNDDGPSAWEFALKWSRGCFVIWNLETHQADRVLPCALAY